MESTEDNGTTRTFVRGSVVALTFHLGSLTTHIDETTGNEDGKTCLGRDGRRSGGHGVVGECAVPRKFLFTLCMLEERQCLSGKR